LTIVSNIPPGKTQGKRRKCLHVMLIGLSTPFIQFIKILSPWCYEKKLGLWESSLHSKKPVSLGWLLFLTNTMCIVPLKERIFQDIPMGCNGK